MAKCDYCERGAGEACVSITGKILVSPHGSRVHNAHVALVNEGRPCRASRAIAGGSSKALGREHWLRRGGPSGIDRTVHEERLQDTRQEPITRDYITRLMDKLK